jgi:hypothetical protein
VLDTVRTGAEERTGAGAGAGAGRGAGAAAGAGRGAGAAAGRATTSATDGLGAEIDPWAAIGATGWGCAAGFATGSGMAGAGAGAGASVRLPGRASAKILSIDSSAAAAACAADTIPTGARIPAIQAVSSTRLKMNLQVEETPQNSFLSSFGCSKRSPPQIGCGEAVKNRGFPWIRQCVGGYRMAIPAWFRGGNLIPARVPILDFRRPKRDGGWPFLLGQPGGS